VSDVFTVSVPADEISTTLLELLTAPQEEIADYTVPDELPSDELPVYANAYERWLAEQPQQQARVVTNVPGVSAPAQQQPGRAGRVRLIQRR